jgi:SAM-dependent methyltransferase
MRREDIIELFDQEYAADYNDRFLLAGDYAETAQYEVSLLQELLEQAGNWLDVACGTGYMLSRFPSVRRAGLDVSPAMIEVAKRENPDADFVLGSFLVDRPEWRSRWDLVSCMWLAYVYVDTVQDVVRLIQNLASWTSVGGTCFLPVCDLEVLCGHEVPFRRWLGSLDGTLQIEAVVWSSLEPSGRQHVNLIAPHTELFVSEFKKYFDEVKVVKYPHSNRDAIESRSRAIIARGRSNEPCHIPHTDICESPGPPDVK